jgi:hypothetical protein
MKEGDLKLKKEMELIRLSLYRALSDEKKDKEKALILSQMLDVLIVKYTKQQIKIAV